VDLASLIVPQPEWLLRLFVHALLGDVVDEVVRLPGTSIILLAEQLNPRVLLLVLVSRLHHTVLVELDAKHVSVSLWLAHLSIVAGMSVVAHAKKVAMAKAEQQRSCGVVRKKKMKRTKPGK